MKKKPALPSPAPVERPPVGDIVSISARVTDDPHGGEVVAIYGDVVVWLEDSGRHDSWDVGEIVIVKRMPDRMKTISVPRLTVGDWVIPKRDDEQMLDERLESLTDDVVTLNIKLAQIIDQSENLCTFVEDYYRSNVTSLASALRTAAGEMLVNAMFVNGMTLSDRIGKVGAA